MKGDKKEVVVKGRIIKMSDTAYKIAEKHFGVTRDRISARSIPKELLQIPKLPIIPAVTVVKEKIMSETEIPEVVIMPEDEIKAPEEIKVKRTRRTKK